MKTKFAAFAVATVIAFMSVSPVFAASDEDATAMFKELDTDGSGTISMDEAEAHPNLAGSFAEGDANEDGQLDMEEFQKMEVSDE